MVIEAAGQVGHGVERPIIHQFRADRTIQSYPKLLLVGSRFAGIAFCC